MSVPSSSNSGASSPSFNNPSSGDDVAAASRFNPLFSNASHPSHINHNLHHSHNQNHSPIPNSKNSISSVNHSQYSISHNHNYNSSTNTIHNYNSSTHKNNHSHKGIINTGMAGNASPNSMQLLDASPSRKVHVVYYLSRSGQLEHPHLLEVSVPPNQGLYLKDVKKRLAAIRGKRLPLTFAWSYKRSYKNGYVWQDLCDDDLIFPAHGCEYVLKGSEILNDQSSSIDDCGHTPAHNSEAGLTTQKGVKEDQGPTSIIPKGVYQNHEEATGGATPGSASLHVSMVEIGTDAATQTEEELRMSNADTHEHEENSNSVYANHYKPNAKHSITSSPHKVSCTTTRPQNATELNRTDIASPPSSSSATNSPSPYKELASTSSSSASGFNVAMEHNDNVASNEQVKASDYHHGSKTPGRTWMKRVTHKLEEQEEIISLHAVDEEEGLNDGVLANPAYDTGSSKSKYRTMGTSSIGAVISEEGEHSPTGSTKASRSKHSGALSLLQFMSCGGLDIKEQILPMSLYRLRSKGAPSAANQLHMSNYILSPEHLGAEGLGYGGSESGKFWTKIGKPKSLYNLNTSKPDDYNGVSDIDNQWVHRKHHHPQPEGASAGQATSPSPNATGSSGKALSGSIPDVISIGRSSMSDRSTNASHELEYQVAEAHAKLKKSGEMISFHNSGTKSSPQFTMGSEGSLDLRNNEGARSTANLVAASRAVSGEILMGKGSPLFVPSKRHLSYSGTPLHYASNGKPPLAQLSSSVLHKLEGGNTPGSTKQDFAQNKAISNSCNPSRAFSEGEVSSLLANRILASNQRSMTINGYDQSMAQLWEELLAAPSASNKSEEQQHKDGDFQRARQQAATSASNSSSSWEVERTLQNAVELSLQPPLEHLPLLLDCPQCGRNVKAELLKTHVKNCSSPKANARPFLNNNNHTNLNTSNSSLNNNSLGKSPKSDSNLCQRFLRASPPPTKL